MLKDFYETTEDYENVEIESNFHTHNYLCGHAEGTVCDYVRTAADCGLVRLGISDHCAPPIGTYMPYITPKTMEKLYLPQFDEAEQKYGDKIEIYRGAEIEYFAKHDGYYDELLGELDYLVLGQHEYFYGGARMDSFCDGVDEGNKLAYFDSVVAGLESSKFAVLAHPDLIFYVDRVITPRVYNAFDEVIRTAVKYDVAIELNANGIRSHAFRYPGDTLIDLCKKHNAKVVVSSDCHSYKYLCDEYMRRLYDYAKKHGLNVVDEINVGRNK